MQDGLYRELEPTLMEAGSPEDHQPKVGSRRKLDALTAFTDRELGTISSRVRDMDSIPAAKGGELEVMLRMVRGGDREAAMGLFSDWETARKHHTIPRMEA